MMDRLKKTNKEHKIEKMNKKIEVKGDLGMNKEVKGEAGNIYINEINGITIHTYVSYTGDASSIIETNESLILIDAQSVHSSSVDLAKYISTLHKSLKQVLVPSHGLGLAYYKGIPIAASEQMISFIHEGKIQVFANIFKGAFGEDLDDEIVPVSLSLKEGENTIEGINFIMTTHENDFPPVSDLEFIEYNILFTHLAADNAHMLVGSRDQINELKDYWTKVQSKNYILILSSHLMPVDARASDFQLEYLEILRDAAKNETKESFIKTMQTAYPDATRQQFLSMTADNFYGQ